MPPTALSTRWQLLPGLLKRQGYATLGAGKWHLGCYSKAQLPESRGFDEWFGYLGGSEDYYYHNRTDKACGGGVTDLWRGTAGGTSGPANTSAYFPNYSPYMFTGFVADAIRAHGTPAPLFVYFAMQSVHAPLEVPQEFFERYSGEEGYGQCARGRGTSPPPRVDSFPCTPRPGYAAFEPGIDCYCNRLVVKAMCSAMDDAVAAVRDAMAAKGMLDNAVVVFAGDNGGPTRNGHSNVPLKGGKLNWWEGGIRPAAFVWSPLLDRRAAGRTFAGIVHETDWVPTLLGLSGLGLGALDYALDYALDGVDLWPTLNDPGATGNVTAHRTEALLAHNILRAGDFKLVAGAGDNNQSWWDGMLRDCVLGTGGGRVRPPNASSGTASRCPATVYDVHTSAPRPGYLSCADVAKGLGGKADAWLCSEPCTRSQPCLFDVTNDPGEEVNVAGEHPGVVAAMTARLDAHRATYWFPPMPPDNGKYCEQVEATGWLQPWM